jgi:hypothetical protein
MMLTIISKLEIFPAVTTLSARAKKYLTQTVMGVVESLKYRAGLKLREASKYLLGLLSMREAPKDKH